MYLFSLRATILNKNHCHVALFICLILCLHYSNYPRVIFRHLLVLTYLLSSSSFGLLLSLSDCIHYLTKIVYDLFFPYFPTFTKVTIGLWSKHLLIVYLLPLQVICSHFIDLQSCSYCLLKRSKQRQLVAVSFAATLSVLDEAQFGMSYRPSAVCVV